MSTLRVNTLQDATGSNQPAMAGAAKAWVNFNGTGTVAIRAAFNVSSITDNGTGQYTINFTTAMPDANYSVCTGIRKSDATDDGNMGIVLGATSTTYSASAFRITTRYFSNEGLKDAETICLSIFR